MENKAANREFEEISAVIRSEEEAALAVFRSRNFRDRVMTEWRETRKGGLPAPKFRRIAVWASASALLVVVAAAVLLVLRTPAPEQRPDFHALASVIGWLPGGASLSRDEPIGPPASGRLEISSLAEFIRSGLAVVETIKREEEERASPSGEPAGVSRLSLYQKMEILFKDKVIERALLLLKDPSKEV